MHKYIFLIFLTKIIFTDSNCSYGCLKCSQNKECLICDLRHHFRPKNKTCEKIILTNCKFIDLQGACKACFEGYIVDPNTKSCIRVPSSNKVSYCREYNSFMSCLKCDPGFYLNNGRCFVPKTPISNCKLYDSEETCLECVSGFYLSINQKFCVAEFIKSQCVLFSYIKCSECKFGFMKNDNKFIFDQFAIGGIFQVDTLDWNILEQSDRNEMTNYKRFQCTKNLLSDCLKPKYFDECEICKSGYFLDQNSRCIINPSPLIPYCRIYKDKNTCNKCIDGYFLKYSRVCQQIEPIINCYKYNNEFATQTICIQCDQSYYLQNNFCVKRQQEVLFCEFYEVSRDKCQICQNQFILNTITFTCEKIINNCKFYTFSLTSVSCAKCEDGFYYIQVTNECFHGSILNCLQYETNQNSCFVCNKDSYLKGGQCLKHPLIINCDDYADIQENECTSCNNFSVKVQHLNGCQAVSRSIPFCEIYQNSTICQQCQIGYYVNGESICQQIDPISNCEIYKLNDGCQKCKNQYLLEKKTCLPPMTIHTNNCIQNYISGEFGVEQEPCEICAQNSFPFNLKGQYYCMEQSRLSAISENYNMPYCLRFALENNVVKCRECKATYFINSSGDCIQENSCFYSAVPLIFNPTYQKKIIKNSCQFLQNGCQLAVVSNFDFITLKCTYCEQANYVHVIESWSQQNNYYIPYKIFEPFSSTLAESPVSFFPFITCIKKTAFFVNNQIVENCEYFILIESLNKYGCVKCKVGFTGEMNTGNYISSCTAMESCSNKQVFGASKNINKIASCYECIQTEKIPFIFISGGASYSKINFIARYNSNFSAEAFLSITTSCLKVNTADLKINGLLNFPQFCAIGIYNVDSIKDASNSNLEQNIDRTKIAVFCGSCLSGFRPVNGKDSLGEVIEDLISDCVEISNCLNSTWMNYCSQCSSQYVWGYTQIKGILYDQCVFYSKDINCLSVEDLGTQKKCRVCKAGYYLNLDYFCEIIAFQKCDNFQIGLPAISQHYSTIHYFFTDLEGCKTCIDNYQLFFQDFSKNFPTCLSTNYLTTSHDLSVYIQYCKNYFANLENISCYECESGYTRNQSGTICINIELVGCLQMVDGSNILCSFCKDDSIAVKGKCEKKNIANCLTYQTGVYSDIQICTKCEDSFFWNGQQCIIGKISNCIKYGTNENDCVKCKNSYALGNSLDNQKYCIFGDNDLNCEIYSNFNNDVVDCTKCKQDFFLVNTVNSYRKQSCFPLPHNPHCIKFNLNNSLYLSLLNCQQCENGYYLNNNVCIQRTKINENCIEYSSTSPICVNCSDSYFTNQQGDCEKNPTGIENCVEYSNEITCLKCSKLYYTTGSKCERSSVEIEGCLVYDSKGNCLECEAKYFKDNNICKLSIAGNCASYLDRDTCNQCLSGFGFNQNQNGEIECVFITIPQNCLITENQFPFSCTKCVSGYYLKEKICVQINKIIENCIDYISPIQCEKCQTNSVLSYDKQQCLPINLFTQFVDENCAYTYVSDSIDCQQCSFGFYLLNGICLPCQILNCGFCNPKKPKECLMCEFDYYMNEQDECKLNPQNKQLVEFVKGGFIWDVLIVIYLNLIQFYQNIYKIFFNKNEQKNKYKSILCQKKRNFIKKLKKN